MPEVYDPAGACSPPQEDARSQSKPLPRLAAVAPRDRSHQVLLVAMTFREADEKRAASAQRIAANVEQIGVLWREIEEELTSLDRLGLEADEANEAMAAFGHEKFKPSVEAPYTMASVRAALPASLRGGLDG